MVVKMAPPNKNLRSMEISSTTFSEVRRKVRKCWRLWTITPGKRWIDRIDVIAYKEGRLEYVIAQESDNTYYPDRKLCQV